MKPSTSRIALLVLLALPASALGATAPRTAQPVLERSATDPPDLPLDAIEARLETAFPGGASSDPGAKAGPGDLRRFLAELDREDLPAVHHEQILRALARRLASEPSSATGRAILEELAARPSRAVRHWNHEGALIEEPLHDVAAAAREALALWDRRQAAERVRHAARSAPEGLLDLLDPPRTDSGSDSESDSTHELEFRLTPEGRGALAALSDLEAVELDRLGDRLLRELPDRPGLAAAAGEIGLLRSRPELLAAVVRRGAEPVALAAIRALPGPFDPAETTALLRTALDRPALASAALLALAPLATEAGPPREILFEFLADPAHGGSAAAALAGIPDPRVSSRLEGTLDALTADPASPDPTRAARIVLALRLRDDSWSRRALERFADADGPALETLREEVRRWLAR